MNGSRIREILKDVTGDRNDDAIERTVRENSEADKAAKRLVERLRNSPDRGIGGTITWTRDELYDR